MGEGIQTATAATDAKAAPLKELNIVGSNEVKNEKVNYSFNIVVLNGICRSVRVPRIAIYREFH